MIDRRGVTVDDEGNVLGVTEAVAAFKEKKPGYFTAPVAPPPPPRISGGPPPPPPLAPGATPPTSVRALPKADYESQKAAQLRSLKGLG